MSIHNDEFEYKDDFRQGSQQTIARLVSCLKNARNILGSEGYFYAKEIDKLLAELGLQ
jgi:hypothetical protein